MSRVAVIGAGWSGLTCALELTRRGVAVALFDAAPQAGGRARAVSLHLGEREYHLDNGQHLLIGAYTQTLHLMAEVGVDPGSALLRLPFELRYPDGFLLRSRRLPAPLHLAMGLLTAQRLSWPARASLLRFVHRWRQRGWRLAEDASARSLLADAPDELVRRIFRPLCLAALNAELQQASAQVLLNVLRDSLAGGARAADLLIPRRDLSRLLAEPALDALARRRAEIRLRCPVHRLQRTGTRWTIDSRCGSHDVDAVVLALSPQRAADLLASAELAEAAVAVGMLRAISMAPIATVYLRYRSTLRLPHPAYTLLDDAATGRFGQWVFDRGALDDANAGVLSVVISAADPAAAADPTALAAAVAAQLAADLGLPAPLAGTVITEKRATIVPAPGLRRPSTRLPVAGLYLGGDAADSDYPSTLEGSVRAGMAAARALTDELRAR